MSCETSNRLLTISFYNPCWQCSIPWGCSASDGPFKLIKTFGMFTSVWMPLKSTTALCFDGVSVPHILSLSPNCLRDFCRCTGIVRSWLSLYCVPSLNSAYLQASLKSHCWNHCESDPSYQDFPMSSQRRAATWAIWVCFHSLTASSVSLDCVPVVGQNDEQSTAEVLHNRRKTPSIQLVIFHLSHGLSGNWLWPCIHTSLQSHWEPRAWCSPWNLEVRTCRELLCLEQWQQSCCWQKQQTRWTFSDALTNHFYAKLPPKSHIWIYLLLLHWIFGIWEAPLEGINTEIQVPPNSLNTSPDDGLGGYKA